MTGVIYVLSIIICTDGYICERDDDTLLIPQPGFSDCLENLESISVQQKNIAKDSDFTFIASCGVMELEEYKQRFQ